MPRRGILTALAVLTAVSITGCSGETVKETAAAQEADPGITLEVYAWQDDEKDNLNLLAEKYMEQHPDITIKTNFVPVTEFTQQMRVLKSRGKQVDCIFNPNTAAAVVMKNKGLLKNLDAWLEGTDTEQQYGQWYQGGGDDIGSYMMPYRMSRWVVYYNKTLFDRLGVSYPEERWTWEDYEKKAAELTRRLAGVQTYGSLSFDPGSIWWRVPARTAGANNPMEPRDLAEFKKAAEWCYHLTYDLGAQMPYSERTGSSGSGYEGTFLQGNIGMYFCGDWSVAVLNKKIETDYPNFVYDVAPMPHWEGEENWVISDAAVVSVAEAALYPDEAADFVKFVSGEEGAKLLAAQSIIPAWNSPEIVEAFSNAADMPEHTEYFFQKGKASQIPADYRYDEAMEIMRDEVTLYLLQEQSLEKTFQNIELEISSLE